MNVGRSYFIFFIECLVSTSLISYKHNALRINSIHNAINIKSISSSHVHVLYPSELQLNIANTSDKEAVFLDLHLSISNDNVSTKIYDKRDNFDFEIVNFPFKIVMFLALHPMESISLNSFVLLEHLAMLLTSTLEINC